MVHIVAPDNPTGAAAQPDDYRKTPTPGSGEQQPQEPGTSHTGLPDSEEPLPGNESRAAVSAHG